MDVAMLEQVETVFDDMSDMMKKLKKASYEKNMKGFRERNDHFFQEMAEHVEGVQEKETGAREVAVAFVDAAQKRFTKKGKIGSRTQADMNFFMIYYVFPAILLQGGDNDDLIAQSIRDEWGVRFKDSKIQYADYDHIYAAFHEKILGIF
jgi:hypothetical protein